MGGGGGQLLPPPPPTVHQRQYTCCCNSINGYTPYTIVAAYRSKIVVLI